LTQLDDAMTYSFLSTVYVHGNDNRILLDEFENIFFEALNTRYVEVKLATNKLTGSTSSDPATPPPLKAISSTLVNTTPPVGQRSTTTPTLHTSNSTPNSNNRYLWQRGLTLQHMRYHIKTSQDVLKPKSGGFAIVDEFDKLTLKDYTSYIKVCPLLLLPENLY